MANNLPPLNYKEFQKLPYTAQEYLRILRSIVVGSISGSVPWASVNKSGSNLNEIVSRDHADLQNMQGGSVGQRYHLTSAQQTDVTTIPTITTNVATLTTNVSTLTTTVAALPVFASGTYTPTLFNVANVAASTAYQCQYIRQGAIVTVSGKVDIDPTAAASTQLGISLPVASNLGAQEDCAGTAAASGIAGMVAAIRGDAANNRAELVYVAVDLTNQPMYFTFTYEII